MASTTTTTQTEPAIPGSPVDEHEGSCFPISAPSFKGLQKLPALTRPSQRVAAFTIPTYVWCSVFTAIGGFLFGFDTGSIGPVTVMSQFQHHFFTTGKIDPTIQGLIVSSILLTAAPASLVSGPLSNHISRTMTIAVGAITFAVGSAIACSSGPLAQLFVGRCVAGIGEGLFLSTVTVYAVEIAPSSARGRIGTVIQLFITAGIAAGMPCSSYHDLCFLERTLCQATSCATAPRASRPRYRGASRLGCRRFYLSCLRRAARSCHTRRGG